MNQGTLNGDNDTVSGTTLTQGWDLDATGNWKGYDQSNATPAYQTTRQHNKANEIKKITTHSGKPTWASPPAYDNNGNMTTLPQPEALDDSYTAIYDAWNRLVKLTDEEDQTVAEYEYDGLNRRTVKRIYDNGALDQTRHAYYSDRWQVLEERIDSETTAESQYLWGERYIDDLVLRDHDAERLYALQDALFNVVALTDDTGNVKERFAYQPYSQSEELNPDFTSYTGSDYNWTYRFTGRELDLDTHLQLNRHRWYYQQLGRWLTRDPIGYRGGTYNLYEYLNGMPLLSIDPFGLSPISINPIGQPGRPGIQFPGFFPDGTRRTPEQCCSDYLKQGEVLGLVAGGVVCCNGNKVACAWRTVVPPPDLMPPNQTAEYIERACIKAHEKEHFDDVEDCDPNRCLYRPDWKPEMNEDERDRSECNALTVQVDCLRNKLKDCRGDRDCELIVGALLQAKIYERNEACAKAGVPINP